MDVQCERCKTEYDFDDALVSGRGTTVKCTNCGFQFKVHKQVNDGADDRWVVRTEDGQELVFVALKDLQKAIIAKQVGRHDTLSRGKGPPRALTNIAELAPFFEEQRKRQTSIPPPLPPPAAAPRRVSSPDRHEREPDRGRVTTQTGLAVPSHPPPLPGRRDRMDTLRPPSEANAAVPPPPAVAAASLKPVSAVPQVLTPPPPPPPVVPSKRPSFPSTPDDAAPRGAVTATQAGRVAPDLSSPLPPPTRPARRPIDATDDTSDPMSGAMRGEMESLLPSQRTGRRVGGWVVAVALILCVGLLGVIVGRKYMPQQGGAAAAPETQLDPRALDFLRVGERALDDGDTEAAKENFDKASVIAEKSPRVLLDLARLATVRADVPWLKLRLMDAPAASAPDHAGDENRRALAELAMKARTAADVALAAAPDDPVAVRIKMDALRIAGERDQARAYVARVITNAQQPETAYVLAALDLAEPEPLWKTIVERLRIAAQAEGNAGRARAALVYALARSGDLPGAKIEAERLGLLARPSPLLAPLRSYLDKSPGKADAGAAPIASAAASSASVDVASLPRQGGGGGGGGGGGDFTPSSSDSSKSLVAQGNSALGRRDYTRASQLFSAALDKNPSDSEALAGLGDAARGQHDLPGARASYQRAVGVNGHYLPALVGLADAEWDMGEKTSAIKRYKEMLDNFPEAALPSYVKTRAEGPAHPAAPAPSSSGAAAGGDGTP